MVLDEDGVVAVAVVVELVAGEFAEFLGTQAGVQAENPPTASQCGGQAIMSRKSANSGGTVVRNLRSSSSVKRFVSGSVSVTLGNFFGQAQSLNLAPQRCIPRYEGDVPGPRGGIRGVIPRTGGVLAEHRDGRVVAQAGGGERSPL